MIIRDATLEDAIGIATVQVSSWQTSYKGLMPDEAIASRSLERRLANWEKNLSNEERQSITLVAVIEGKVVGFVTGGKPQNVVEGFDGELYAIYLLQDAQGEGIGRKLMQTLATRMHKAGYKNLILSVLKNNTKSRGFYEKMGGTLVGEGEYQVTEDVTLTTIKYGLERYTHLSRRKLMLRCHRYCQKLIKMV